MIDYALDSLVEAGVETVVVNVHHHADQMIAHLGARSDVNILISDERSQLMNSGGGLAKGLKLLEPGPVFVMNADLFWIGEMPNAVSNLRRLAHFFDPTRMDMALLCVDMDRTTGHNGKKDFNLADDGKLTRYRDRDPFPVVYAGAIAMNSRLLDDAPDDAFNLNIYFDRAIEKIGSSAFLLMATGLPSARPTRLMMPKASSGNSRKSALHDGLPPRKTRADDRCGNPVPQNARRKRSARDIDSRLSI